MSKTPKPTTEFRLATVPSFDAILADEDYKRRSQTATALSASCTRRKRKKIDRIQKDILSIVHNEKPFDVFICYKETDENGNRTQDSVIANDIYHQLTQEGFKVFYAAITLEDKSRAGNTSRIFSPRSTALRSCLL